MSVAVDAHILRAIAVGHRNRILHPTVFALDLGLNGPAIRLLLGRRERLLQRGPGIRNVSWLEAGEVHLERLVVRACHLARGAVHLVFHKLVAVVAQHLDRVVPGVAVALERGVDRLALALLLGRVDGLRAWLKSSR